MRGCEEEEEEEEEVLGGGVRRCRDMYGAGVGKRCGWKRGEKLF